MNVTRRASQITVGLALVVLVAACGAAPPTPAPPAVVAPTTVPAPPTTATSPTAYDIVIRPSGSMDPAALAAFEQAAQRWERIITADVPAVTPPSSFTGCLGVGPTGTIDDMVIDVQVTPIDGVNGVLGSAGPCGTGSDGLPRAGQMKFDSADVATMLGNGRFLQVVLHEMAHVLGFGTTWDSRVLAGDGTGDPRFIGTNAVAAYATMGGSGTVPVEATGGSGTAYAHWRESTFGSELMTGWINGGSNPLSRLSLASMADIGYQVDLSQADAYTLPSSLLGPALRAAPQAPDDDVELVTPSTTFAPAS